MAVKAFQDYLEHERKYSVHTVRAYTRDVEQFAAYCLEEFEETKPQDASYSLIRSWIITLMDEGLDNRSVNRKIASLKSFYNYQLRQGHIESSPLAGHRALKTSRKVEVPFSEEEMQQLLTAWPEEGSFEPMRDRLLVELLYSTGIRRAELIELKLENLDWDQHTLKVLGKRKKERILPLLPHLFGYFQRYLDLRSQLIGAHESPFIFLTSSGNKLYETLVYRIINEYLSKVSVKAKRSPHILRHTFATHLLNQGADMNSVKELLGHASLASTQVYTHNSIAELKRIHHSSHPRNKR